jgi:1-aminocyclopropane-1-carboxylate deaminase
MHEALVLQPPFIQTVHFPQKFRTTADVLRLDVLHTVVSGNKWFKLQPYLQEAQELQKKTVLTFGGAYSNHIAATAAACHAHGLQSIGIIRGERPDALSPALEDAAHYGMKLCFVSRTAYTAKAVPEEVWQQHDRNNLYIIAEGGYGKKGSEGAMQILASVDTSSYTHILAACGTGTMLSGLVNAALPHQQVMGVSVLKNHTGLEEDVRQLLHHAQSASFQLLHDYHFGGYAKSTPALFAFMNGLYASGNVATDFVYTGKLFYAAYDLLKKGFFADEARLLLIHSGGLQGNRSLKQGTLIY